MHLIKAPYRASVQVEPFHPFNIHLTFPTPQPLSCPNNTIACTEHVQNRRPPVKGITGIAPDPAMHYMRKAKYFVERPVIDE